MKEYLKACVSTCPTPTHGKCLLREYLQARILGCTQQAGGMIPLAFHGGTCLRFLYSIPRFSEDLDFTLERPDAAYDFRGVLKSIQRIFDAEGYSIQLKVSDKKAVHSAFVRFPSLLFELGLSPHREEVFSVKIEVDTRPPDGAVLATTIVRRHVTLHLQHHDRSSLLAGKLHAVLCRPYVKGRDIYDLLWYLSDPTWPPPNLTLLNNALRQSGKQRMNLTEENWRIAVKERLESVAFDRVADDVRPFLERSEEVSLLTLENLNRLLGKTR